jgi:hypothetical protein
MTTVYLPLKLTLDNDCFFKVFGCFLLFAVVSSSRIRFPQLVLRFAALLGSSAL